MKRELLAAAAAAMVFVSPAFAETVVSPGGQPGVATSWVKKGDALTFTLKEGFSADDVADAILRAVPGSTAKAKGGKVVVTGVEEKELLVALERVQVDRGLDDIDNALASLQGNKEEEGSGSSIRASKATQIGEAAEQTFEVTGKVSMVRHKTYPKVALELEVSDAGAAKLPGKITVVPRVKIESGRPVMSDPETKANAAAWYVRQGDSVKVKIFLSPDKKTYVATAFARQR
ncbi:MAG: hypothetical protein HY791_33195 [Deltaproteobacteria bacterium]|nr:hypothetical protein [Deltaproteobacteria bacterium]